MEDGSRAGSTQHELATRLELMTFLERNPYAWDTSAGFSRKLGRDEGAVRQALEHLEQLGIVDQRGTDARKVYHYRQPVPAEESTPVANQVPTGLRAVAPR